MSNKNQGGSWDGGRLKRALEVLGDIACVPDSSQITDPSNGDTRQRKFHELENMNEYDNQAKKRKAVTDDILIQIQELVAANSELSNQVSDFKKQKTDYEQKLSKATETIDELQLVLNHASATKSLFSKAPKQPKFCVGAWC